MIKNHLGQIFYLRIEIFTVWNTFKDYFCAQFFAKKRPVASLINFDADLYDSTLCALNHCKSIIDNKTLLIFDEFIMNENWEKDEFRALNDFCETYKFKYHVIAVCLFSQQVAVKIEKHK